jgi:hypothetical protein
MSPVLLLAALAVALQQPVSGSAPSEQPAAQLLAAARGQINAHNLDSAAVLLRRVTGASARPVSERVQAWVILGVVDFYRSGDSAAAAALRAALALDPGFESSALEAAYPEVAEILTTERTNARVGIAAALMAQPVKECVSKCPEGLVPPQFTYFPEIRIVDANVGGGVYDRRMHSYLIFEAVIAAEGFVERESLLLKSGTARNAEGELRRALSQARLTPPRLNGVPVRARVGLRFDFEQEGINWIKYTYRVVTH